MRIRQYDPLSRSEKTFLNSNKSRWGPLTTLQSSLWNVINKLGSLSPSITFIHCTVLWWRLIHGKFKTKNVYILYTRIYIPSSSPKCYNKSVCVRAPNRQQRRATVLAVMVYSRFYTTVRSNPRFKTWP